MQRKYRIVILNLALSILFFALGLYFAPHVHAQMPGLPFQLYGTVTSSDQSPVKGVKVEAYISGVVVATSVTNTEGKYGVAPDVLIIPNNGDIKAGTEITFTVNGMSVSQTALFEAGTLQNLDLHLFAPIQSAIPTSRVVPSGSVLGASTSLTYATSSLATISVSVPKHASTGSIVQLKKDKAQPHKHTFIWIVLGMFAFLSLFLYSLYSSLRGSFPFRLLSALKWPP